MKFSRKFLDPTSGANPKTQKALTIAAQADLFRRLAARPISRHIHPVAQPQSSTPSRGAALKQFLVELKRRKVYRVAVAYVVVAWVLIQVATQVLPFYEIPNWTVRLVITALVLGFPMAVILAWAYDITPSGIKRTEDVAPGGIAPTGQYRRKASRLPFENLSDDRENTFFADGVHDDILSSLAKIADLKVISRTSVQQYRAGLRNLREIGQALGVAHVLEGTVRRAGNRVRVNAQLDQRPDGRPCLGGDFRSRTDRSFRDPD